MVAVVTGGGGGGELLVFMGKPMLEKMYLRCVDGEISSLLIRRKLNPS